MPHRARIPISKTVQGLAPSATVAINELSNQLRAQGRTIYKLGLGQSPFPVPAPVVDALRANASRKDYLAVRGLEALREAVSGYLRRRHGVARTADDVLVGPGSKELMFILQVVFDGELVLPTPAWVSYAPQARIIGRPVTLLHTAAADGYKLTPDSLAALGEERPRVLLLNYPSNPTGVSYSADELKLLADAARERGILVLSDEIYGELHHHGRHVSIASFYPEGTIVATGLSKWCGAGGWRLGVFSFPPEARHLAESMAAVASESYTSTSAPIQYAAVRAFEGGEEIERYLSRARRLLEALTAACVETLVAADVRVPEVDGGFYLFVDLGAYGAHLRDRGLGTGRALAAKLMADTGVAALPGEEFGRPAEELTLRLALVDFDGARALTELEARPADQPIDREFLEANCRPVLEAVKQICSWLRTQAGGSESRHDPDPTS